MSITTSTIPLTASSSIMSDVNLSKELMRDLQFMQLALQQAELSLHVEEIPVGCVIILDNKVIASGYNQTNITRNGTKHAEMVAIESLLLKEGGGFDFSCFHNYSLYVTCEPCIMCAAALSKLGFCEVIFGCDNDRFGGNGSILSIHTIGSQSHSNTQVASSSINMSSSSSYKSDNSNNHNSSSAITSTTTTSASISIDSLAQYSSSQYHAYPVRRGVLKEEAIAIFQKFYLSENRRAPESKRKRKALRVLSNHKQDNNDITNATLTTATNSTNI